MSRTIYRLLKQNLDHNCQHQQFVAPSDFFHLPFFFLVKLTIRNIRFMGLLVAFVFVCFLWTSGTSASPGTSASDNDEVGKINIMNDSYLVCNENYTDARLYIRDKPRSEYDNLSVIYFITPTYPRREQVPELTRLSHTLLHIPRLHWIVANDFETCNVFLDSLLNKLGIPYTHLASPMPSKYRTNSIPRGVANRRAAMMWLRKHNITNGILYFGDDDNTYDLKLFSEIRQTQRVSMFPVGLVGKYSVSGPVVSNGIVIGFCDSWIADRRWPVDMAGFAVNLSYMSKYPYVWMPFKEGFQEDIFLRSIGLKINYIEPKGSNCTEILVWHTQTRKAQSPVLRIKNEWLDDRLNLNRLFETLRITGIAYVDYQYGINVSLSKNGHDMPYSYFLD